MVRTPKILLGLDRHGRWWVTANGPKSPSTPSRISRVTFVNNARQVSTPAVLYQPTSRVWTTGCPDTCAPAPLAQRAVGSRHSRGRHQVSPTHSNPCGEFLSRRN